jgi:hypothetical protein
MNPLFRILFNDKSEFIGGDLIETKWQNIPDKKIITLIYFLPIGDALILSDYNAYYHFVEVTQDLIGPKKGQVQIEFINLIGKKDTIYKLYRINLKTKQIEIKLLDKNDKLIKELNPIGWKKGI